MISKNVSSFISASVRINVAFLPSWPHFLYKTLWGRKFHGNVVMILFHRSQSYNVQGLTRVVGNEVGRGNMEKSIIIDDAKKDLLL